MDSSPTRGLAGTQCGWPGRPAAGWCAHAGPPLDPGPKDVEHRRRTGARPGQGFTSACAEP